MSKKIQKSEGLAVEAKAQQLVLDMFEAKEDIKDVKNALKAYKIASPEMESLKAKRKELNQMIAEEKERIERGFDPTYNELREQLLVAQEKHAIAKQAIKVALMDPARDKDFVEMDFRVKGMPVKIQAQLSLKLFSNGKEEK